MGGAFVFPRWCGADCPPKNSYGPSPLSRGLWVSVTPVVVSWMPIDFTVSDCIVMGMETKESAMQQTPGTMGSKGTDYVANWPTVIARKFHLSAEHTAIAMKLAGIITSDDDCYRLRSAFLSKEATPEVAALTPDTARRVITELKAIGAEIRQAESTTCRYCGQPLFNGACEQCGEPLA